MSAKLQNRDLRVVAKKLKPQGWTWRYTKGGNVQWRGPNGEIVIGASTPGGGRADRNLTASLRRAGAQL